jgi:hypothetical protein
MKTNLTASLSTLPPAEMSRAVDALTPAQMGEVLGDLIISGLAAKPAALPPYILARRTKGKKWEGVAAWQPDTGQTCLATAEDAFRRAGYTVESLPGPGGLAVGWGDVFRRQKNYTQPAPLAVISGTVSEVGEWADLARAREYIANGWNLESQPEALAAAKRAGLVPA